MDEQGNWDGMIKELKEKVILCFETIFGIF
jgi:hypothetical protein